MGASDADHVSRGKEVSATRNYGVVVVRVGDFCAAGCANFAKSPNNRQKESTHAGKLKRRKPHLAVGISRIAL